MPTAVDLEIGKSAVKANLITQDQLDECLGILHVLEKKGTPKDLLALLMQRGYLTAEKARQIPGMTEGIVSRATTAQSQAPATPPPPGARDTGPIARSVVETPESAAKPGTLLKTPKPGAKLSSYAFIYLSGGGQSEVCFLPEKPVAIGRDAVNDIVVDDEPVSKRHARLTFSNNEMTLWDVGSKNGTFVNGERVTNRKLVPGDVVNIGNARLIFVKGMKPDGTLSGPLAPPGAEAGAQAVFTARKGLKPTDKFFLGKSPVFIGREKYNNIAINDASVSPYHAQIVKSGNEVKIQDLNSTSGVKVNGEKISVAVLEPDDLISIGNADLFCEEVLGKRGTGTAKPAEPGGARREAGLSTIITDVATELRKSPVGLGAELLKELEEKAVEPAVRPRGAAPASTEPVRPPSALQFTCVAGPVKGKSYPIGKRTLTIGRSPTADIFLEELSVSREHAVIRPIEKRVEIVDLESRNGVEVNGKRVKVKPINVGDKVTIGKCIFIVEAMES